MIEQRARRSEATRNDSAIQDAAIAQIASAGWDELAMASVGAPAGLSYGAVYARFPDKIALGRSLWRSTLGPELSGLYDLWVTAVRSGDSGLFKEAWQTATCPSDALRASVELVMAARFDHDLVEVWTSTEGHLARWCSPARGVSRAQCAVNATAAFMMFGLIQASQRPWVVSIDQARERDRFFAAMTSPAVPRALPRVRPAYLSTTVFDSGDPRIDAALQATTDLVGRVGYAQATIAQICRQAGITPGLLYKRYPSKLDLYLDATDQLLANAFGEGQAWLRDVRSNYGDAVGEAVAWREHMRPQLAVQRAVVLETERLAAHLPAITAVLRARENALLKAALRGSRGAARKQLVGWFHSEIALGIGVVLTGNLLPEAWRLPYDAVTTPLLEG